MAAVAGKDSAIRRLVHDLLLALSIKYGGIEVKAKYYEAESYVFLFCSVCILSSWTGSDD